MWLIVSSLTTWPTFAIIITIIIIQIFLGIQQGGRDGIRDSRISLKCETPDDLSDHGRKAVVEFTASSYAVMENEGNVKIGIKRTGCLDIPAVVRYVFTEPSWAGCDTRSIFKQSTTGLN